MMKIMNPATGKLIQEINTDTAATLKGKFEIQLSYQKQLARTRGDEAQQSKHFKERLQMMAKFRDILASEVEPLAKILTSEVGKPISQARNEIKGTLKRIDFFLEHTPKMLERERVFQDAQIDEVIEQEPLGIIANISAWNYPYFVGANVFVPALLTGNSVLYKPSEFATLTGVAIGERLHQAGFTVGAFQTVIGEGSVGAELLKLPIAGVFFTGSYATGKKIAESVAGRMIRTQFELGGKDPIYVCEDIDVASAAEGLADGAFYNAGQSCCSVERIYVHEKIYDAFVEHFVKTVKAFVIGDPLDEKTYIGPLTRAAQMDVLQEQVSDAQKKGAKLLCGGKALDGHTGAYFAPTVFSDVNASMTLMREESFGPIIGIQKVQNDEEALDLMNDSSYGLTAGVYTRDKSRAQKLLAQVHAGSVYWNCCDRVSPQLPWSGRGHSGMGTTLSRAGILTFVQPKAWHLRGIQG